MPALHAAFIAALNSSSIIHFKDKRLPDLSPRHYYVAIPVNKAVSLLLCIITSKIEGRVAYAKKTNTLGGLVLVSNKDISCLSMASVIDCNQTSVVSKNPEELDWLDVETFKMCGPISSDVRNKVFTAIRKSPVVSDAIKQMLPV